MAKSLRAERVFSVVGYAALLMFWWVTLQFVIQAGYNTFHHGVSALFFIVNVTIFATSAIGSIFYLATSKNTALAIAKSVVLSLLGMGFAFLSLWYSGTVLL